jgi:hypothetical protein
MLDIGATVGSYLGSDYNQTRLKMDDIYTFEKNLSEVFNITIKKGASRFHVQTCHILTGGILSI